MKLHESLYGLKGAMALQNQSRCDRCESRLAALIVPGVILQKIHPGDGTQTHIHDDELRLLLLNQV